MFNNYETERKWEICLTIMRLKESMFNNYETERKQEVCLTIMRQKLNRQYV